MNHPGWQRVILISPFSHAAVGHNAFIDHIIQKCDLYLAITGNYWFNTIPDSVFAHWLPKMVHLDMAVDRADFPVIKTHFNPRGSRSFLYIGIDTAQKNLGYLNRIAGQLPGTRFSWIGTGRNFTHLKPLGFMDFSNPQARSLVQQHDFLITVGQSDANPTTILEAMSWGLLPVCTQQSGYSGFPGIINVPLRDEVQAAEILRGLQEIPESRLLETQSTNWEILDEHFNWDRFARQVVEAIETDASPPVVPAHIYRRLYIRWMELLSPYAIWRRPRYLSRLLIYATRQLFSR